MLFTQDLKRAFLRAGLSVAVVVSHGGSDTARMTRTVAPAIGRAP